MELVWFGLVWPALVPVSDSYESRVSVLAGQIAGLKRIFFGNVISIMSYHNT